MKNSALLVAGILFAVVAAVHLLRLAFHVEIIASNYVVPMNISWIGFAVTALMALWMFVARRSKK